MALTLRPATDADREFFFDLRNDPVAVKYSLMQTAVTPDEHAQWWANTREFRYVMEDIGYVRLGVGAGRAVVSIAVAAPKRGKGYARLLLRLAHEEAARLGVTRLVADILPANTPSLRAFLRDGYEVTQVVPGPTHLVLERAV
jgi:RimJ/RimL family protein N-acetyltransferase